MGEAAWVHQHLRCGWLCAGGCARQVGRLRRPTLPDLRAGGCAARILSYQPLDPANRGGCCHARDVKANRARQPAGQRREGRERRDRAARARRELR